MAYEFFRTIIKGFAILALLLVVFLMIVIILNGFTSTHEAVTISFGCIETIQPTTSLLQLVPEA
jgi:hypothetical protein